MQAGVALIPEAIPEATRSSSSSSSATVRAGGEKHTLIRLRPPSTVVVSTTT